MSNADAGDEGFIAVAIALCPAGKFGKGLFFVSHERGALGVGHTPRLAGAGAGAGEFLA